MKKIFALLLAALLLAGVLSAGASAASAEDAKPTADALNSLGLFLGTGVVDGKPKYELGGTLTRAHGVILLVRLLGKEALAESGSYQHPFTDTRAWYDKHVAYAYATGLTNGTGKNTYSGEAAMSAEMFATFCLRALGYDDGAGDFNWRKAPEFAEKLGIKVNTQGTFLRGDAVTTFWNAMNTPMKGKTSTLADKLIADGVFTKAAFAQAQKIAAGSAAGADNSDNELPADDVGGASSGGGGGTTPPVTSPDPQDNSGGFELPIIPLN